eukprot:12070609-Ditylum_brightwellii.AAC.1
MLMGDDDVSKGAVAVAVGVEGVVTVYESRPSLRCHAACDAFTKVFQRAALLFKALCSTHP